MNWNANVGSILLPRLSGPAVSLNLCTFSRLTARRQGPNTSPAPCCTARYGGMAAGSGGSSQIRPSRPWTREARLGRPSPGFAGMAQPRGFETREGMVRRMEHASHMATAVVLMLLCLARLDLCSSLRIVRSSTSWPCGCSFAPQKPRECTSRAGRTGQGGTRRMPRHLPWPLQRREEDGSPKETTQKHRATCAPAPIHGL